ncbi:MAG: tRNA pseudouridine(55) synthase TruB [Lachnospiraceae bacterium]
MVHGVINIYKEKGYTSHDVVARLRGIVGQRKIGHTGTLDPDAVGVLPVCLGKATKLCDLLTDKDKTYQAVLLLGVDTDTQDTTGTVLTKYPTKHLTEDMVREAITYFVGSYGQIPPMYSALKVNGKKLYELARAGQEIERKPRDITIYSIHIESMELPRVTVTVRCSKGTYIRTLCHDIGTRLQCGGCMESLIRTKVGQFQIEDSITLDEAEQKKKDGILTDVILPIDDMFLQYPLVVVTHEARELLYNGNPFNADCIQESVRLKDQEKVRVYDEGGRFIALYQYQEEQHQYKIVKMFFDKNEIVQEG